MPTFNELQQRLTTAKFRKAVLLHVIEYLDANFLPVGGQSPAQVLQTDDKLPVPVEIFEALNTDTFSAEVLQLETEIASIMGAQLGPGAPLQQTQATDAPPRPVRGRRSQPRGEHR